MQAVIFFKKNSTRGGTISGLAPAPGAGRCCRQCGCHHHFQGQQPGPCQHGGACQGHKVIGDAGLSRAGEEQGRNLVEQGPLPRQHRFLAPVPGGNGVAELDDAEAGIGGGPDG